MRQVPTTETSGLLYPILWVSLFDQICLTITFPLLTFICFDQQSSLFTVASSHTDRSLWYGTFWAIPHFIAILFAPLLAILSDKFGRKKLMTIGAFGALGFSLFMALGVIKGSITLILIGSLICGICVRTEPIALASVADCSSNDTKLANIGLLQLFISIGALAGPIICGYFAKRYFFKELNFALPCLIGMFFGITTLVITQLFFQETNNCKTTTISLYDKIKHYFKQTIIRKIALLLILSQIGWGLYYQFITPILKIEFHYSTFYIGIFAGCIALWLIIGSSFGIKIFSSHFNMRETIYISLILMLSGLICALLLVFAHNFFIVNTLAWLSALALAIGDVILFCAICTLFSNSVASNEQGIIMGINFILISVVWTITGFIGGALESLSNFLPIIVGCGSIIILLVFSKIILDFKMDI